MTSNTSIAPPITGGAANATHYIRIDFLEQVVLQEIKRLTRFASEYEDDFVRAIIGHSTQRVETERAIKQRTFDGLLVRVKAFRTELKMDNNQQYTADTFLEIVHRHIDSDALSQHMVTELINHIDVYHAVRINGEITQEVKIYYNCIGAFDVPDRESTPELEILIETRKEVALSYSQAKKAE